MQTRPIFASAAVLGVTLGLALTAMTPIALKPMEQGEWRNRAMMLRDQTSALYNHTRPQDLSPQGGFGNPAYHSAYARMWTPVGPVASEPQPEPAEAPDLIEPEPVAVTGNEGVIAELETLNDSFEPVPPAEQPPAAELAEAPAT